MIRYDIYGLADDKVIFPHSAVGRTPEDQTLRTASYPLGLPTLCIVQRILD